MVHRMLLGVILTLGLLSLLSYTSAQTCANTDGSCPHLIHVSQCSESEVDKCCARCSDLAGCGNTAVNCYTNYEDHDCYDENVRNPCCLRCKAVEKPHLGNGCLYGDKTDATCDPTRCDDPSVASVCCDTCFQGVRPTIPPTLSTQRPQPTTAGECTDSGLIECTVPAMVCYSSTLYKRECCATCYAARMPELGQDCIYGDRISDCADANIQTCTNDTAVMKDCCGTCYDITRTTTQSPSTVNPDCSDSNALLCSFLVVPSPWSCYTDAVHQSCCGTCKGKIDDDLPLSCRFGNRDGDCEDADCSDADTKERCCNTCYTPPPTTGTPCNDKADNCARGLPYMLEDNRDKCYREAVREQCCGTCNDLAGPRVGCEWGNQDPICSFFTESRCDEELIKNTCCELCGPKSSTVTPPTTHMTPPPDCTDTINNCEVITKDSLSSCYPDVSSFISDGCCATCHRKRMTQLPENCYFGNRLRCNFVTDPSFCEDPSLREDCCQTCYNLTKTTTIAPSTATVCPNEWRDSTCERLLNQLGNCDTIEEKCCRTCLGAQTTTTAAPTTTTVPQCENELPGDTCEIIIESEGEAECYTGYMIEKCCKSCLGIVTTVAPSTTADPCPGDQLPNCAQLQGLLQADICADDNELRDSCCEFCEVKTTTTPMLTTTAPSECDEDKQWPELSCQVTISTSPLDEPCEEGDIFKVHCCEYCKKIKPTTTTAASTTMITGPPCEGNNPGLDCPGLYQVIDDLCDRETSNLAQPCCEFCNSLVMTTTVAPTGRCSSNVYEEEQCDALVQTQGFLFCAHDLMIENCCLFCTQLTLPPTTTVVTDPPCSGDIAGVNCTLLDDVYNGTICFTDDPDFRSVRLGCCEYCASLPTTTAATTVTTPPCVDQPGNDVFCNGLVLTNQCNISSAIDKCCKTCYDALNPSMAPTSTTPTPTTAGECVDTVGLDCSLFEASFDPCDPSTDLRNECCMYCQTRTTPLACYGDSFPPGGCAIANGTTPNFCDNSTAYDHLIRQCCEFCGHPVLATTTVMMQTDSSSAAPTVAPTTAAPSNCPTEGQFTDLLCQSRLQRDANTCSDELFRDELCCDFCEDLASARKRRSLEDDADHHLHRSKRQTGESCQTTSYDICEALVVSANVDNIYSACAVGAIYNSCCRYCADLVQLDFAEGCSKDIWTDCKLTIDEEGYSSCFTEPLNSTCCLSCKLAAIRNPDVTTARPRTTPSQPSPASQEPTSSQPVTVPTYECKQEYKTRTCEILSNNNDCDSELMITKCCDSACPPTPPQPMTTTTSTPDDISTTTVNVQSHTPTPSTLTSTDASIVIDPPPTCGTSNNANLRSCELLAYALPSRCNEPTTVAECCQTCTDLYYDRKSRGYNVDRCPYGNRDNNCVAIDCTDPNEAKRCCEECYTKEDITPRPVVSTFNAEYTVVLAVETIPCKSEYANHNSNIFIEVSKILRAAVETIFSVLPGSQVYIIQSISCDSEAGQGTPLIVTISLSTPPTHTYRELQQIFSDEIADDKVSFLSVDKDLSSFSFAALFDDSCKKDVATNCDEFTVFGDGQCYHSDAYSGCCTSCTAMATNLYLDRKYIPEGCAYGDRDTQCPTVDCNLPEAGTSCCYTCALEPEDYREPTTTVTTIETTPTPKPTIPPTAKLTTTPQPCQGDIGDRCEALTKSPINCYNVPLVYSQCCQSCNELIRWDLPSTCAWGDKETYCPALSQDSCSEDSVYDVCCDKCGPHLTSTTNTKPTTAELCVDSRDDCKDIEDYKCYSQAGECCATCRDRLRDHLDESCRYGDIEPYCISLKRDDCSGDQIQKQCCELCRPLTTSTTSMETTTTTTIVATDTTTPVCEDKNSVCNLLRTLCYDSSFHDECCSSCASFLRPNAAYNCRYGDHAQYCELVTRERCVTEPRAFTDCCETCEGLVAPPGTCVDTGSNCAELASGPGCYFDLVYGECCKTCEDKARTDLGSNCKWGDLKEVCSSYSRDECETKPQLKEECCALCSDAMPTTPASTTTAEPKCIDERDSCFADTAEHRFCYNEGIEKECCSSCKLAIQSDIPGCEYGNRETWCEYLREEGDRLCKENPVLRDQCCQMCHDVLSTTTSTPTTVNSCVDTHECTDHTSWCYDISYKERCCETCAGIFDPNAPNTCAYGDRASYCGFIEAEKTCLDQAEVREECCKTCSDLLKTTTVSVGTPKTTPAPITTTGSTTETPLCRDDDDSCKAISAVNCYSDSVRESCCVTCAAFHTKDETCAYGDKNADLCTASVDCSLSVTRTICCSTCADYVVPGTVEALYHLKINTLTTRCTSGLMNQEGDAYMAFKYQIELAVTYILDTIPGIQTANLIDIRCNNFAIPIVEIRSRGFYQLDSLSEALLSELADGKLGTIDVSQAGSSLEAVSFSLPSEFTPPNCDNGDVSLNCITSHVMAEPSNCYEPAVRTECCQSCSSLFYARLAGGAAIDTCPYGDKDAECFTDKDNIDCTTAEARDRCCDTCAGVLTPTVAPVTTTEKSCVDEDANLCAQGVQNSLSYCYANGDNCCATCSAKKKPHLLEECAWGNKREYCNNYDKSHCTSGDVISTCCELCGVYTVTTTTATPCVSEDVDGCEIAIDNPSICYGDDFYRGCCNTCNSVKKDYLPSTCHWGDRGDFCDTSNTICNEHGNTLCCETCCTDCIIPTTPPAPTTVATTSITESARPKPPGCAGDDKDTDCAMWLTNPMSCYSSDIASRCCESCYYLRRIDLPESCPYGDKVDTCASITWEQCSELGAELKDICCATCFSMLDISCDANHDVALNCKQTVNLVGSCYSSDVRDECCMSCKFTADYTLPEECRFGDKVTWCNDISTESVKDKVCREKDTQEQCCNTCKEFIGLTTPQPSTTTSTTTIPPTTRLPPNEMCPVGDISNDCDEKTSGTGACYDPDISSVCCRTCYEEYREDLPTTCQYGDKSKYCITVEDVDTEWCVENADTCCARCSGYLTTTIPTTTLPPQCPQGSLLSDCPSWIQAASDCYSPVRENGCCVECAHMLIPGAPFSCRYGDKAAFCADLDVSQCAEHAQTCCQRCAVDTTTAAITTERIERPSALIGLDLFDRPAPPGHITLYQVWLNVDESCTNIPGSRTSREYEDIENSVCTELSRRLWSMTSCYLSTISCDSNSVRLYDLMILVDRSLNYDNVDDVTANRLRDEISQSQPTQAAVYSEVTVRDVNECDATEEKIKNKCSFKADCQNTEGLYECTCHTGLIGDGFDCRVEVDPMIGRDSFLRRNPPVYWLYEVDLRLDSTSTIEHDCFNGMSDNTSPAYIAMEQRICSEMGSAMRSLYACYVEDFDCNGPFKAKIYVLIDVHKNYKNNVTTTNLLKEELDDYNGVLTYKMVRDVDECHVGIDILKHRCRPDDTCRNEPGLYTCEKRIERPSALIGLDLFDRPAPPGDITLYQVWLNVDESCTNIPGSRTSREYEDIENSVCTELSRRLWSMTSCYLSTISCDSNSVRLYDLMILVDRSLNYDNVDDVTANRLRDEILTSQSRVKRSTVYSGVTVRDVNECDVTEEKIKNKCSFKADCQNTEGLYGCTCYTGLIGDGFDCLEEVDPMIGRDSFLRSTPPVYWLYEVELNLEKTSTTDHSCFDGMNNAQSPAYVAMEQRICSEMGSAMRSLYACYVEDFNCDGLFKAKIYVLIDVHKNYENSVTTTNLLKEELNGYNGVLTSKLVRDVDECNIGIDILKHRCDPDATCYNNKPGLYTCECNIGNGDGFTCGTADGQAQSTSRPVSPLLQDWAIALIVIGSVITLVAFLLATVCCCRYCRNKSDGHEPLDSGEVTPPRTTNSLPPFYNSMRSTKAPHSEVGSYFFAQQERELPGYAMKTYNVRDGEIDPTIYNFE